MHQKSNMNLLEILNFSKEYLQKYSFSKPRLESEKLIAAVLKLDRITLYAYFDMELTTEQKDTIKKYLREMARGRIGFDELIEKKGDLELDTKNYKEENYDLLKKSIEYLEKHQVPNARLDAEYIFAHILKVKIDTKDLKIDTYRSGGAGGQHVNMTDSAVRITHLPTGIVVQCQDERSQLKNREKAMKHLVSKLYEMECEKQRSQVESERKLQVGTGDRSEKIRTYNFPQGRITDHRIKFTVYQLDAFLDGDIDEMIDALITFNQAEMLASASEE